MEAITKQNTTQYFFSKQNSLLSQYQKIVSTHYKNELDISLDNANSNWNVHTIKRSGDSLIALQDNNVIGGAMLYKSAGSRHQLLPLEANRPLLEEIYGFDLSTTPYCEVGRLAIRKQYRSMATVTGLIDYIVKQAYQQGMHYLFVLAPRSNAVLYRRVCKTLNIKMGMIDFSNDKLPALYQHLSFRLIRVNLLEQPWSRQQAALHYSH